MAGIVLGFLLRGCGSSEIPNNPEPIVLHDTITISDPVDIAAHTKPKVVVRWDTIYLPGNDKTNDKFGIGEKGNDKTNDTTDADYALVPITQSEYRDTFATDSTRAELAVLFSGYNAKIDSVGLTYEATIQPKVYVKKKGWGQFVGIGVGAGYGASVVGNQVFASPQVGISIVYGFGYHW